MEQPGSFRVAVLVSGRRKFVYRDVWEPESKTLVEEGEESVERLGKVAVCVPETAKSPRVGGEGEEHGIRVIFPGFQKNLVVFFEEGHFPALVVEAIETGEDHHPLRVVGVSEHK